MPLHKLTPKRLHNGKAPQTPEKKHPSPLPTRKPAPAGDFEESKGDARLIDHVPFEKCAHESFSEKFCVPGTGRYDRWKIVKQPKDEGDIIRVHMEEFLEKILTQKERRGYWEVRPHLWVLEDSEGMPTREVMVLEFESFSFVVQCEEKKLIRISDKDLVAMLWSCLDAGSPFSPPIKKATGTWASWTDEDKATFRWEIRGRKKTAEDPTSAVSVLQQKTKSFFKTHLTSPAKAKGQEKETKESGRRSMDLLTKCMSEMDMGQKHRSP